MTTISIGNGLPVPVLIGDVMTDQDWQHLEIFRSFVDGRWYASARTPALLVDHSFKSFVVSVPLPVDIENELRSMMTKAFNERKMNTK